MDDLLPGATAVEELLLQLENAAKSRDEVEIWVPDRLKLRGEPIAHDWAMTVVLDRALALDLEPDGFTPGDGGRLYRYLK